MQRFSFRWLGSGLAAAGLLAAGVVGLTGSAAAEQARGGGGGSTIAMKLDGRDLVFDGPKAIERNTRLTILNKTKPSQVGPHTFTLVRKGKKPFSRILQAHEVGPPPEQKVGRRIVEAGKKGWNRAFTKDQNGDSWFTDERGAKHTRNVTAKVGRTLRFYCAVHPFMKGKFEVTR
jgi:hypothetical protein